MENTIDSILQDFETKVKENQPISPAEFLNGAIKLNALQGTLDNETLEAEMAFNCEKATMIESNMPNAKADTLAKATDKYKEYKKNKAKCDRVIEFIRIAKLRSKLNEF